MDRRRLLKLLFSLPWSHLFTSLGFAQELTVDISSLRSAWDALEFSLPTRGTLPGTDKSPQIPAVVIRLAGGMKTEDALFVASRICPHERCELLYFKDPNQLQQIFRVRAENPVLACPCHLSVFDLRQEGKVINGPAPRPPFRFRFRVQGNKLMILGLEEPGR